MPMPVPAQVNTKFRGMSQDALMLARWFVSTCLSDQFNPYQHERQVFAADALLQAGYTTAEVRGAITAFLEGRLACTDYRRSQAVSLFSLTTATYDDYGRITSPIKEYLHRQKVSSYRERPAILEAMSLREGSYFQPVPAV